MFLFCFLKKNILPLQKMRRMKKFHYIITWVILLVGIPACQRHTDYPHSMQQAETLMDVRPDSALHLLQGMADTLSMLPAEAQVYYHLLTIQAKDKQYITHTDDSLINSIVSFYEDLSDKERLMLAYYYQGSVYRDMNDAPRALKAFQQAMDLNVPNYDLQAKAYNQMGTLFMYQGLHDEVIRVNRKAMELYILQGKRNKISYFQRDIARMYDIKNMPDSALHYYQEACQTALTDGDSVRYYGILGEFGGYYYKIGNIDKAKQIIKRTELSNYIRNKAHIYSTLGSLYHYEQKLDSAYYYKMKVLEFGNINKAYSSYVELAILESIKGKHREAIHNFRKAIELNDSIQRMTQTEAIAKINTLYNYQHTEEKNIRLELEKEKQEYWNLFFCASSVCMLILSGTFILFQKRKKEKLLSRIEEKKKQDEQKYNSSLAAIKTNQQKITELEESLKEKKTENNQLQQKLAEVQKEKLKAQNEVIKQWNEEQRLRLLSFKNSEVYKDLLQASKDEEFNMNPISHPDKWMVIQENIDSIYPGFTERLCKLCPALSDKDLQVCYLTKIGMSPSDISRVLRQSRQAITNTRTRIMQKLGSLMAEKSNFDDFIEDF